jgi:ParB/RepB/Spo0J family partition protein
VPFTDELHDPATIVVARDERQRRDLKLDEAFVASVRANGVLEPLIVERTTRRLVAGERRLTAAIECGIHVPVRWLDELNANELKKIELEENVKRQDLNWRDQVRAYGELYALYAQEAEAAGEPWGFAQGATRFAIAPQHMSRVLRVYANLDSPRIADATSYLHAIGILQRFAERKASAIVAEITASGSRLFSLTPPTPGTNGHAPNTPTPHVPSETYGSGNSITDGSGAGSGAWSLASLANIGGTDSISTLPPPPATSSPPPAPALDPARPITTASFLDFAPTYAGEPFTFVHCDFPYGVNTADSLIESYDNDGKIYWALLDCLCQHVNRLFSYSAHLMFWLSMRDDYFQPTKQRLRACGFHVIDRPLIWLKSDSRGAAPGIRGTQPRHIYEAALLCSRGQRPLVKQFGDGYAAPSVSTPIHPTQKPEAMLRHFFAGLVDETTTFFDPTAGSGASLRAAEDLGARCAFGLELNEGYAAAANAATLSWRSKRNGARAAGR